jgi:NAD(P)-dependent dehydrogenase (short-subunit alcohol dehydrogenase family)
VEGRSALISGGTGGLGVAVVEAFLADGWRVTVPWIAERELERLPEREGLELVRADLGKPEDAAAAVAWAGSDRNVPLRAVVNLAGGYAAPGRVHETAIEEFEAQFALNLRSTYLVCQAALPDLVDAGGGAIVCTSSRAAVQPFAGAAGYVASKAAVIAFMKALDVEYRDDGVRANAILPSVIDTPANRAGMQNADHSRWVKPAEVAAVVRFLCSADSEPVSGAAIPVYGRA